LRHYVCVKRKSCSDAYLSKTRKTIKMIQQACILGEYTVLGRPLQNARKPPRKSLLQPNAVLRYNAGLSESIKT
jgi:hypothetical protein